MFKNEVYSQTNANHMMSEQKRKEKKRKMLFWGHLDVHHPTWSGKNNILLIYAVITPLSVTVPQVGRLPLYF